MSFVRRKGPLRWNPRASVGQLALAMLLVHMTDATCNEEQMSSCRKAAIDKQLESLPGGGQCIAKQYVQFTHSCTVTNYMPSIDHCCCAYDQKVLCCRYHQDWDHFRCSEADDTIETLAESSLPLEILLPAIFGPLVVLTCCVVCCVKCWCNSYEEDAEVFCCCCKKCCEDKELGEEKRLPHDGRRNRGDASVPLTLGHRASAMAAQTSQDGSETKLLQCPSESSRVEPTAPPLCLEANDSSAFAPPTLSHNHVIAPKDNYQRSQSVPAHAHCLQDARDCYACATNGNGGASQRPICPSCSSCPPPSYDESQQHPVLPPHELHHLHTSMPNHLIHAAQAREHYRCDRTHSFDEAPTCSFQVSDHI